MLVTISTLLNLIIFFLPHCLSGDTAVHVPVKPEPAVLSVSAEGVTEQGSISVSCIAPSTARVVSWRLYSDTQHSPLRNDTRGGGRVRFTVTGRELLQGATLFRLYTIARVSCDYTEMETLAVSQRSDSAAVKVYGQLPEPKMRATPTVIRESDSVQLRCEGPGSPSDSQCNFYIGAKELPSSTCQRSVTGVELLKEQSPSTYTEVQVKCQYTVNIGYNINSPYSGSVTVTLLDLTKPNISVSTHRTETQIRCEAPSPITGAVFQLYNRGVNASKENQAGPGERAVTFTVPDDPNLRYCCSYQYRRFKSALSDCVGPKRHPETGWFPTVGVVSAVCVVLLGVTAVCLYWRCKKCGSNSL
ncbi:uncharacterized protein si:ch211-11c3.9 [Megalops cyprinoides]|uniref:uncharacterized protein si:ch211-11c3.9 n=1 Tax=Megalops cyprinoides TaxID=118141 RepID=UPI00186421CD|nr:uncharacterized protein si:ch211-11c3.9 [Megalops cyprinoides]